VGHGGGGREGACSRWGRGRAVGGEEGVGREGNVRVRGRKVGVTGGVRHGRRRLWRAVVGSEEGGRRGGAVQWHLVSVRKPGSSMFLIYMVINRFLSFLMPVNIFLVAVGLRTFYCFVVFLWISTF